MEGQDKNIPEFPHTIERDNTGNPFIEPGMTLRDYLAAKAMQGILSQDECNITNKYANDVAKSSYYMAEAMLKARNQ